MKLVHRAVALTLLVAALGAQAQTPAPVRVDNAWARASVPGQQASGAFMTLTAPAGTRLVGASSPAAGAAEVHEMAMQGDVMRMRAIDGLDLPAGRPVELKPGGMHVMLTGLKAPLAAGSQLPLTLRFRDAQGVESQRELLVPVRALGAAPAAPEHGAHHHH